MSHTLLKIHLTEEPMTIAWIVAMCFAAVAFYNARKGVWGKEGLAALCFALLAGLFGFRSQQGFLLIIVHGDGRFETWFELLSIYLPVFVVIAANVRYRHYRGRPYVEPPEATRGVRFVYHLGIFLNLLICGMIVFMVEFAPGGSPSHIPNEYWSDFDAAINYRTYLIAFFFTIGLVIWTLFARNLLRQLEEAIKGTGTGEGDSGGNTKGDAGGDEGDAA